MAMKSSYTTRWDTIRFPDGATNARVPVGVTELAGMGSV
jgi:hypothetical protein